ncbi:MAG TPA: ABC transporter substrate-binding protein [Candidatus Binatia bacterium]|jgi:NitT/TauT family transport system substrate-binding protein|nr:ABC transporter substrate-binding protein [Candidatus Binatia bacterium]
MILARTQKTCATGTLTLLVLSILSLQSTYAQERITLGLTTRNGSTSLPYVVAEEKGFFKAEGLNALVVIMQNQVVVNGVLSRHVDYGGTFSNFVGAAMSGAPVRIVMSVMDGADHFLVTSPNIKRVEDLKGKTFGISSFGGTPHSEAVAILRKYNLNPEKDVTFLQVGGSSARYMSLESGSIQAAMIVPPFNHMAKKRGFNQLLGFNEIMSMPVGGLAVHMQKMKEKPDEIVKMIRALIKSLEYIRTRKADILAIIDKQWGIKEADVREEMYREMIGLFSRTGIAPDESMRNVIRLVRETRKSSPDVGINDVADWSFARKAQ